MGVEPTAAVRYDPVCLFVPPQVRPQLSLRSGTGFSLATSRSSYLIIQASARVFRPPPLPTVLVRAGVRASERVRERGRGEKKGGGCLITSAHTSAHTTLPTPPCPHHSAHTTLPTPLYWNILGVSNGGSIDPSQPGTGRRGARGIGTEYARGRLELQAASWWSRGRPAPLPDPGPGSAPPPLPP